MDETVDYTELSYEELEQALHDYKMLVKSRGWERLETEVVRPQIELRKNMISTLDDDGLEGWGAYRRMVGEIGGLQLKMTIPHAIIEQLEELLDERREQAERDSE